MAARIQATSNIQPVTTTNIRRAQVRTPTTRSNAQVRTPTTRSNTQVGTPTTRSNTQVRTPTTRSNTQVRTPTTRSNTRPVNRRPTPRPQRRYPVNRRRSNIVTTSVYSPTYVAPQGTRVTRTIYQPVPIQQPQPQQSFMNMDRNVLIIAGVVGLCICCLLVIFIILALRRK
jgi:hypothetical protein